MSQLQVFIRFYLLIKYVSLTNTVGRPKVRHVESKNGHVFEMTGNRQFLLTAVPSGKITVYCTFTFLSVVMFYWLHFDEFMNEHDCLFSHSTIFTTVGFSESVSFILLL